MDARIGATAANVESVLVQIAGEVSQQECQSCQKNKGPWAHCVRFHDLNRTLTACGNCHWNGQKKRCEFYQLPVDETTTYHHRRDRSSTSSLGSVGIRLSEEQNLVAARITAVEALERELRNKQAVRSVEDVQNAAIYNAMRSENAGEIIVAARVFIPPTTSEQHRAQFERVFALIDKIRQTLTNSTGI